MSAAKKAFALVAVCLLLTAVSSDASTLVSVDASPACIPADGKSCAQILITVLDQTGASVSDDTEIRLSTSAGDVTPAVYTTGGRAVGILTSSSCPQIATVTAIVGGSSGSVQVEFSSADEEPGAVGAGTIRMTGGSLAYSVGNDTVMGSGGVSIEYKGVTVQASGAQICQNLGQIRAQGEVSVRRQDQTLTADALVCDIRNDRIRLMESGDQPDVRTFAVDKLRPIATEDKQANSQNFQPLAGASGGTWIISKRLALIPGEKILFYKASIYVGESKVLSMPYYSYSYEKRESILQQVRFNSNDGVRVDFPFYYQLTDSKTGALKLRYAANGNEAGGYSRPRKGLSLGLEQDYSIDDRSRGRFFIDSVGSSTQAFELSHHLEFGSAITGGRAEISTRYQPLSSYARNMYQTTLSMTGGMQSWNYSLSGYFGGSSIQRYSSTDPDAVDYVAQSSCTMRATFKPKAPLKSALLGKVTQSWTLGYGSLVHSSGGATSSRTYQSFGLSFSRGSSDRKKASLSFDGASALTLTSRGETGSSLRMGPTLKSRWVGGDASIRYTLNLQGGANTSSVLSRHQLGCSLFLNGGARWSSNSSVSYGLDSRRLNLYTALNYRLTKLWRMRSNYNLYQYVTWLSGRRYCYGTSYLKIGLYRPIGMYEVGVAWSPDGQDYGIDKSRHVWLELNSSAF